jgi:hypothetical protein
MTWGAVIWSAVKFYAWVFAAACLFDLVVNVVGAL